MNWYREFGFDYNPLSIKPSEKFELFFDNKNILDDIINAIKKRENVVLKGSLGTGKTSLFKRIIKRFGGDRKLYYYNAFSASSSLDFERVLEKAGGFFSRIFGIKSREVVLFIDEASHLTEENIKELKKYLGEYFKSVVLASSDPKYKVPEELKESFTQTIDFGNFTQKDASNIIKNRLGEENYKKIFKDSDIKSIYQKSETPREFLLKCDSFCHEKYSK